MAESSWPTASGGGVVGTTWEQMAVNFFADGLHGTASGSPVVYADSTGRQVKLLPNRPGSVRGFTWVTDATLTKSVAANTTSGTTRIDRVVLGLNRSSAWPVTAYVKTGSAVTSNPQPPALQQDPTSGGTGIYEIPLARIGPLAAGFTTVAATDVHQEAWTIAAPSLNALSTAMPPAGRRGCRLYQEDTGKTLVDNGSAWTSGFEDSGYQSLSPATGWTMNYGDVRNRNGECTAIFSFKRTGAALAAGTDNVIGTVPQAYRPSRNRAVAAFLYPGMGLISGTIFPTGAITIQLYAVTIPQSTSTATYTVTALCPTNWFMG